MLDLQYNFRQACGTKIGAIKVLRDVTGMSLLEAKVAVCDGEFHASEDLHDAILRALHPFGSVRASNPGGHTDAQLRVFLAVRRIRFHLRNHFESRVVDPVLNKIADGLDFIEGKIC